MLYASTLTFDKKKTRKALSLFGSRTELFCTKIYIPILIYIVVQKRIVAPQLDFIVIVSANGHSRSLGLG